MYASTTIKKTPTALAVTPTAGSTRTLEVFRNYASDKTTFVGTEDTGGVNRDTLTVQATPTTVTLQAGVPTYSLGAKKLSYKPVTDVSGTKWQSTFNVTAFVNEAILTEAQIQALQWEFVQFVGSAAFTKLLYNNAVN